jgi:hypothetical protein
MTREEFETECRSICIHCREGIALRRRDDTGEFVHDGTIQIPGTLGRRHSHTICLAHDFRNANKDSISG